MSDERITCLAEKKEYVAVDVMKLVAAYLNMSVHFLIFEDINKELNFWFTQVLCRLMIPFFFLASGYFVANKLANKAKTVVYLKRIGLMYLVYTILFIPFIVEEYRNCEYTFLQGLFLFLKNFFFVGSYFHLWYFLALIVAVALLYIMLNCWKLEDKTILCITGILYCIGTLGNAYRNIWTRVPVIDVIFSAYETIFVSTVNGVFFGAFLVAIGYYIRKNSDRLTYKRYWAYAMLFFFMMNIEEYFARAITLHNGQAMLFSTPLAATALFLMLCFIRIPQRLAPVGVFMRNMSVIVYGFHIFIHLKYGAELSGYVTYGFAYYLMMAKRVTILAVAIVGLSRFKPFSWLKVFY